MMGIGLQMGWNSERILKIYTQRKEHTHEASKGPTDFNPDHAHFAG